jgi:CheY-like chemotaxis protein
MLATHGREILAQRTLDEQNLLNGFLVKPVTASMLYEALMEAGSGNSGLRTAAKGRSNARQLRGMRVLVVEDNLINQQVADELLSAEGAIVSLAANGQIAVDAVAAAAPQFDVVLMDVQMPVLDGYGATKAIREELGLARLPIIAMTANAMASDRDTCIAAGMNEHVGKPFDMAKLVSLLIRITKFESVAEPELQVSDKVHLALPEVVGLDIQTALMRMSGMRGLYVRTARDFVKIMDTIVPELEQCLVAGDRHLAMMRLHTLKGNAGTLGATDLAAMAAKLEVMCKSDAGMNECAQRLKDFATLIRSTQQMLREAIAHLDLAPLPTHMTLSEAPSKTSALEALREVADLAAASDMDALLRFAEVRQILSTLPGDFIDRLDQALQDIDLEAANVICEELLAPTPKPAI